MRVLVAPDKFKGSLTAVEVASAIGEGLDAAGVASLALPLADGGDGSVAAALSSGFTPRTVAVRGADGRLVDADYAVDATTAVVEVASTCGLSTLAAGVLAPMTASSYGFGQAVRAAFETGSGAASSSVPGAGVRRLVLALGGSASTDGGAGMLAALGVRFLDGRGRDVLPSGGNLLDLAGVDATGLVDLAGFELVVATDVTNPLLGGNGAATVFGPQKGATPEQVRRLDAGLTHLALLLAEAPAPGAARPGAPRGLAEEPGAGAAGGIGFACRWLGARRVPGADFFLDLLGFDDAVAGCDAVVTGEGRIDAQTLAGKLPAVVAARSAPRPVYAVVGRSDLSDDQRRRLGLREVYALARLSEADSHRDPQLSFRLARLAGERIGRSLRARAPSLIE